MTRLAWMTDIHLNFLSIPQIETWLESVAAQNPDALLITGDIGEAPTVCDFLIRIVERLNRPVYFVLGNHDYYFGSVDGVRMAVTRLCAEYEHLHWLPLLDVVPLAPETALVGHGCWSDGGYGDFLKSNVLLNDYFLISELAQCHMDLPQVLATIQELGQEGGDYLRRVLPRALAEYPHVYVALHSPPFRESAWHEGRIPPENDAHLPHFTCKAAGDALLDSAARFPNASMRVLCGHTHGTGESQIRSNLRVVTGGAEYGRPRVQRMINADSTP